MQRKLELEGAITGAQYKSLKTGFPPPNAIRIRPRKKTLRVLVSRHFLSQLAFYYLAVSTIIIFPLGNANTAFYALLEAVKYA